MHSPLEVDGIGGLSMRILVVVLAIELHACSNFLNIEIILRTKICGVQLIQLFQK